MKQFLKISSTILASCLFILLFILEQTPFIEGYNLTNPNIDTYYAKNYNEGNFKKITLGTDSITIVKLIGQPVN